LAVFELEKDWIARNLLPDPLYLGSGFAAPFAGKHVEDKLLKLGGAVISNHTAGAHLDGVSLGQYLHFYVVIGDSHALGTGAGVRNEDQAQQYGKYWSSANSHLYSF
jgi:hypothetical protein